MEKSVLFSEMTPDPSWEDSFNDWYDTEHIPLRMDLTGFSGAQRYRRGERDYLAVYDINSPEVLTSDAYKAVKDHPSDQTAQMLRDVSNFTRYIGRPIGFQSNTENDDFLSAPLLYSVFFDVPEDRLADFDEWYDVDHVPKLLGAPDWLAVRRFELTISAPGTFNRLALHYLADKAALESDARKSARESEWREKLAHEPWFKGTYAIFKAHGKRFVGKNDGI